jgi:hypothetical protein
MKLSSAYPVDVFFAAISSTIGRMLSLALGVVAGLGVGTFAAHGARFTWSMAMEPLAWATVAWLLRPASLVVNVVTLLALVSLLRAETMTKIVSVCLAVLVAWAGLAYFWT